MTESSYIVQTGPELTIFLQAVQVLGLQMWAHVYLSLNLNLAVWAGLVASQWALVHTHFLSPIFTWVLNSQT